MQKNQPVFAVQYLDSLPLGVTTSMVRQHLRESFARLPISLVLLGWNLPTNFEEAIAEETAMNKAKLFRWQPVLTGDSHTDLPDEWQTIGVDNHPIPGHAGIPEFTFICPNRVDVADFLSERIEKIISTGLYQGFFLDRIRFPSPTSDPFKKLACFCKDCQRLSADIGLDLESVRRELSRIVENEDGVRYFIHRLFSKVEETDELGRFLDFRFHSISRLVHAIAAQVKSQGLEVGLDCFTPSLAPMVGQDLSRLSSSCRWLKIMVYPRVFGPAGLSFEFAALLDWLISKCGFDEESALTLLAESSALPLPTSRRELVTNGLASDSIAAEIRRGYALKIKSLYAGIALVEMPDIHESNEKQIIADLQTCRDSQVAGLVLSWDLWLIPPRYLDLINRIWRED